jgi:hypothetical protein
MKPLLYLSASIALLSIGACTSLLLLDARALAKAQFGVAQREGQKTRDMLERQANQLRADVMLRVDGIAGRANGQVTSLRTEVLERVDRGLTLADSRLSAAQSSLDGLRGDLQPVLRNAATLEANYATLPDRLSAELRPSWLAIQPEITCRQLDGAGYGGCWHSRITAVLGETAKAGGVFTQKFPMLVDTFQDTNRHFAGMTGSFDHILGEVDKRYFSPRTTRQKIVSGMQDGFQIAVLLAIHLL